MSGPSSVKSEFRILDMGHYRLVILLPFQMVFSWKVRVVQFPILFWFVRSGEYNDPLKWVVAIFFTKGIISK